MSATKPYEQQLLDPAEIKLSKFAKEKIDTSFELRLQLLEAVACRLGSFQIDQYFARFDIQPVADYEWLDKAAKSILESISLVDIHPALALSALSREPLTNSDQKSTGAYYTDFRLAQYLASMAKGSLFEGAKVLDPASGAGALLVAVTIAVCGADRKKASIWLANSIYAFDLSPLALRGARLALASLTDNLQAVSSMWRNWRNQNSLLTKEKVWSDLAPAGFDLVIANPPWEKVKLTRHEYLKASGDNRHYGDKYDAINEEEYHQKRSDLAGYASQLINKFSLLGGGEPDLYMAFLQLSTQLLRPEGQMSILVPAGLIRSKGTSGLRRYLIDNSKELSFAVIENRARFFSIDTRFKFLAINYKKSDEVNRLSKGAIRLLHAVGTPQGVETSGVANIDRDLLPEIRPDLTIPEVRDDNEWQLFVSMVKNGLNWADRNSMWYPDIVREVDMTRERPKFLQECKGTSYPVVEGRMVQGFRLGAKKYISGTGRRAVWLPLPTGHSKISPQFWVQRKDLTAKVADRCEKRRVCFCDITGQTNERSMMAALVPPGIVCGNKVPTVVFPNDPTDKRRLLWLGIVNSLPFDWMMRRVVTTTVNYFLLLSLPLPCLEPRTLPGRQVVHAVSQLLELDSSGEDYDPWVAAELRADIDISILISYGLDQKNLKIILNDFPLLDRGQPAIYGEVSSTITRDYLLCRAAKRFKLPLGETGKRLEMAKECGAVPYVPSEMKSYYIKKNRVQHDG